MENLLKNRDFAIFAVDSNNNGTMSYVIKDHQGSMYATVTGNTVERYSFDAWGRRRNPQTLSYDNVTTSFDRGYTLHEHYDDFGFINMNGRLYDPTIGRFMQTDPMAESSYWLTPYHYCSNNPIRKIDPTGMNDDWIYDKEKDQYVWDGNVIDENSTPDGFEYIGRSLNDVNDHFKENNPFLSIFINPKFGPDRTPYPGEIRDAGFDLEMWLDSPSEGALATVGKIGSNFLYNIVNSPYVLFTGHTIGGRHVTSNKIVESFCNVAISVIAFGLRGTGQVLKTGEGLQGYNDFLKKSSKMGTLFNGIGWQKQAGKAFKTNKNIYKSIDSYDNFKYIIDGLHSTYDEIKK